MREPRSVEEAAEQWRQSLHLFGSLGAASIALAVIISLVLISGAHVGG